MTDLQDTMFTTPEMAAIFSGESRVQRMLDFEAALARAEARAGVIPPDAAVAITAKCKADLFDLAALYGEAAVKGTPAIPLVRMLGELVDDEARGYVHWGSTSQDVIDSGMILQVRDGLDVLIAELMRTGRACASLAERHASPMPGRTLLQHALPITFGLKAARWLALTTRRVRGLLELRSRTMVVQFGGAAGTLASLDDRGLQVAEYLAEELNLGVPDLPWHTERDRVADIATALGTLAGAMAKIANDVALLMQTEVEEVSEGAGAGKGTSSAMPQKQNPVLAAAAVASARLAIGSVPVVLSAMMQEHERAAGGWQAEWIAIPDLFHFVAAATARVRTIAENIEIDVDRMRANLHLNGGQIMAEALVMALAPQVGRLEAYELVASACERAAEQGSDLRNVVTGDARISGALSPDELARALDPGSYLGSTEAFIRRALDDFQELAERATTTP